MFFVSALVFLHIAFKMICFTVYLKKPMEIMGLRSYTERRIKIKPKPF